MNMVLDNELKKCLPQNDLVVSRAIELQEDILNRFPKVELLLSDGPDVILDALMIL